MIATAVVLLCLARATGDCQDSDSGALDAANYDCAGGYTGMPHYCAGYDDSDFTSSMMCCECQNSGGDDDGQCEDSDDGAVDMANYDCGGGYTGMPHYCGSYDDDDFTSSMMCCECMQAPATCTTEDLDSQAIALFAQAGVAIGGCGDLGPFCMDVDIGQHIQALCCATCGGGSDCQDSDAGAVDSYDYSCASGYSGMPQFCGLYDDSDFTSSILCCDCLGEDVSPAPTPGSSVCEDLDGGAVDSFNYACQGGYTGFPQFCGMYDDSDFTSSMMCCECMAPAPAPPGGGGSCTDSPQDWHDGDYYSDGGPFGCDDYIVAGWCTTSGGDGPGWNSAWGSVSDYPNMGHSAFEACCGCGGGGGGGGYCEDSDAGALDAGNYDCEGGYLGMPHYCNQYDDDDFTSSMMCCVCGGGDGNGGDDDDGECADSDMGALDAANYDCEGGYTGMPHYCGGYDDNDFTSSIMCCECADASPSPSPSNSPSPTAPSTTLSSVTTGTASTLTTGTSATTATTATTAASVTTATTATAVTTVTTVTATASTVTATETATMTTGSTSSGTTGTTGTTSSTTTKKVEYVVSQSMSFASSGTVETVSNAVTTMVTSQFGVSASQVHVAVSSSGSSGGRRLTKTQWQVDYEITLDSDGAAAGSILEAATASSTNPGAMVQSLSAALQAEGANLDAGSVTVAAPVIATNTFTVTSRTATATTATTTESSATSTTTFTSETASSTTVSATSVSATTVSTLTTTTVSTGTDTFTTTSVTTTSVTTTSISATSVTATSVTATSGTSGTTTTPFTTTATTISTTAVTTMLTTSATTTTATTTTATTTTGTTTTVTETATGGAAAAVAASVGASSGEGEAGEASGMGAIIGGGASGLALIAIAGGALFYRRRRRSRSASGGSNPKGANDAAAAELGDASVTV